MLASTVHLLYVGSCCSGNRIDRFLQLLPEFAVVPSWTVLADFFGGVVVGWDGLIIAGANRGRLAGAPRPAADIPMGVSGSWTGSDLERISQSDHSWALCPGWGFFAGWVPTCFITSTLCDQGNTGQTSKE